MTRLFFETGSPGIFVAAAAAEARAYHPWSRRAWLGAQAAAWLVPGLSPRLAIGTTKTRGQVVGPHTLAAHAAAQSLALESGPAEALAVRAVDVAKAAGAQFATARLTRTTSHVYEVVAERPVIVTELIGVGVQALVDGYWGFASSPVWDAEEVVRLAKAAVSQARANARANAGRPVAKRRTVNLDRVPAVTGTWRTPIQIDPFGVTIEEKADYLESWQLAAAQAGMVISPQDLLRFARQERVTANTEGTRVTQTVFETGGELTFNDGADNTTWVPIGGFEQAASGWELFAAAKIPERIASMREAVREERALAGRARPASVGAYTLVCDGATMAALLDATLGAATQLDRALGYEANASGTSYLDDPLAMVGQEQVGAPLVTVSANRSAPGQLATVKWDDEGVAPEEFTLVKDGVLVDFQTTRESASWLKDYYAKAGKPVRSHGCAASETALVTTIQHSPNLALEPATGGGTLEDLVASVSDGVLVTGGVARTDFQARTGMLFGHARQIRNGKLGARLTGGAVQFSSTDLWKKVTAVGNGSTLQVLPLTQYGERLALWGMMPPGVGKGEPRQVASHSAAAAAAVIAPQPLIDPSRRA